ncbi:hypothetical protein FHR55_003847 [Xanthomonas arboricola]
MKFHRALLAAHPHIGGFSPRFSLLASPAWHPFVTIAKAIARHIGPLRERVSLALTP